MVEVGIPYSDPIADGPVIAASYHRALERGVKLAQIFETFRTLRAETPTGPLSVAPLVAMVSYAIIHRQGVDRFLREAVTAGFDGLIVPDLPVEESESLCRLATALDLRLIQLVTPTTPRDRAVRIAASTTGFIYYVSVAGITGERQEPAARAGRERRLAPDPDRPADLHRVRDQLARAGPGAGPVADGLIVGSAWFAGSPTRPSCPAPRSSPRSASSSATLAASLEAAMANRPQIRR